MDLQEIENWGQKRDFSKKPLNLNVCQKIRNREKFFNSHLEVLKAQQGKPYDRRKRFKPYYDRLITFISKVSSEKLT